MLRDRKAIIFDFDGTIADTKAGIIATATTVLTEMGLPEEALVRVPDLIGPPFPQAFEWVFGFTPEAAVEATERYRAIYVHRGVESWPAFEGVAELLAALQAAGRLLGVASSKRSDLVCRGLADNAILDHFDTVQARHDDSGTKADAIRAALAELGVTPDEAVMVGDRFHDVEAARACGLPCIGVLYGQTAEEAELWDAGAVEVAGTVEELRALLLG